MLMTVGVIAYDAKNHFNKELVQLKIDHKSDQRHWSLFYNQSNIYQSSSFRYENDFEEIKKIVEPFKKSILFNC